MASIPAGGVGLVLSGGGTRGLAHIGAWEVLATTGWHPAVIVGCSMGAIVGAMIAAGKTPAEMRELVLAQKAAALFQWPITRLGLANLTKFEHRLMSWLGTRRFEGLQYPLIINATNLTTGESIVYDKGLLWPAIRASISVPGLLAPVRQHNHIIVDGGVLNEHPFSLLPPAVQKFVLVNCSPRESLQDRKMSVVDLLRASLNVMQNEITQLRLATIPTWRYALVEPQLHGRNLLETDKKFKELIDLGATAATAQLPDVLRLIK